MKVMLSTHQTDRLLHGNITLSLKVRFTSDELDNVHLKHLDLYNRYWDAQDGIYTIKEL